MYCVILPWWPLSFYHTFCLFYAAVWRILDLDNLLFVYKYTLKLFYDFIIGRPIHIYSVPNLICRYYYYAFIENEGIYLILVIPTFHPSVPSVYLPNHLYYMVHHVLVIHTYYSYIYNKHSSTAYCIHCFFIILLFSLISKSCILPYVNILCIYDHLLSIPNNYFYSDKFYRHSNTDQKYF